MTTMTTMMMVTTAGGANTGMETTDAIWPGPPARHGFAMSFDKQILEQGSRTVTPNFFNEAKSGLSNDSVMYQLRGAINGVEGTFEIAARPSVSGRTEVIMHRFFRSDP
jgi:hypothetical protein